MVKRTKNKMMDLCSIVDGLPPKKTSHELNTSTEHDSAALLPSHQVDISSKRPEASGMHDDPPKQPNTNGVQLHQHSPVICSDHVSMERRSTSQPVEGTYGPSLDRDSPINASIQKCLHHNEYNYVTPMCQLSMQAPKQQWAGDLRSLPPSPTAFMHTPLAGMALPPMLSAVTTAAGEIPRLFASSNVFESPTGPNSISESSKLSKPYAEQTERATPICVAHARPTPLHPAVHLQPPALPPAVVPPPRRASVTRQCEVPCSLQNGRCPPGPIVTQGGLATTAESNVVKGETASTRTTSIMVAEPSEKMTQVVPGTPVTLATSTPAAARDTCFSPTTPNSVTTPTPETTPESPNSKDRILVVNSTLCRRARFNAKTHQYTCEKCGRAFFRRSDFARHFQIHLGIKPNLCPICGKAFIQRSALTVHFRIHTGEKPYNCGECGRQFSDSSSLARHRHIHSRKQVSSDVR